jgi:hypothetical protein
MNSVFPLLAALSLTVAGVYCGWLALNGYRSGQVRLVYGSGRAFSRLSNPGSFWIVLCWYLALLGAAVLLDWSFVS